MPFYSAGCLYILRISINHGLIVNMSEKIVSKFGGTSNATGESTRQCLELAGDSHIVIGSAPGKIEAPGLDGQKVTQLLLDVHTVYAGSHNFDESRISAIVGRFEQVAGVAGTLSGKWIDDIAVRARNSAQYGAAAASILGERLMAEIYESTGYELLDPITAGHDLGADKDAWESWLGRVCIPGKRYVLPGNTTVVNSTLTDFERGGSDISAGLAAYGVHADLHWNNTDGCALSADPTKIDRSRLNEIEHLLYVEGRELGRNGTGLVHPAAMVPLMIGNIPTHIRSSFDPDATITVVDNNYDRASRRSGFPVAVSLMDNVSIHDVQVPGMAESVGMLAHIEKALRESAIPLIDSESGGADGQRYLVRSSDSEAAASAIRLAIPKHGTSRSVDGLALLSLVGYNLGNRKADIMVHMLFNLNNHDPKAWQKGGHTLLIGQHVARVTVDREHAQRELEKLHEITLESRTA